MKGPVVPTCIRNRSDGKLGPLWQLLADEAPHLFSVHGDALRDGAEVECGRVHADSVQHRTPRRVGIVSVAERLASLRSLTESGRLAVSRRADRGVGECGGRSVTATDKIAAMHARATSIGTWTDEYDDWRPTYPDAAVDWLVPPNGAHVAEIGAGTGKLTDRLMERGLELDVVEPDGRMLGIIRRRHPRLRTHQTGATSLPLGDASVDAVVVADAWHWFPKEEAAAEVARVLRPNGRLGCVWNVPVLQHESRM